jgi:prepilin-type N-terminal cleavage/methylation domain-containing protein
MIVSVKSLNSWRRLAAFSLIEILSVLVIVGVVLTLTNWPLLGANLLSRVEGRVSAIQVKIDLAILEQSRSSSQKYISVSLDPLCPSHSVQVHLGGLIKPEYFKCEGASFYIGALGEVSLEKS